MFKTRHVTDDLERGRSPLHPWEWVLGILLGVSILTLSEASEFDFSRYHPWMMKDVIAKQPMQTGLVVTPDIPIRSKVTYSGEFRNLSESRRRLIAAWGKAMDVPEVPQAFRSELKVFEAGIEYWVPVQEVLVTAMKAELRFKESVELFMIYIGQIAGGHVFLVNEFWHESPHKGVPPGVHPTTREGFTRLSP